MDGQQKSRAHTQISILIANVIDTRNVTLYQGVKISGSNHGVDVSII